MYTYSQDPYLSHYGVLGMKWGVRRYQNKDGSLTKAGKAHRKIDKHSITTKNNETLTLVRNRGGLIAKGLRKISPKIAKEQDKFYSYDAYVNNKKIGSIDLYKQSKKEMNISWGDTKPKYRGRGYMQAMEKLAEKIAKEHGATKITAELVGNSPDIHTVAKYAGYVKVGEDVSKSAMEVWGGLTFVEKDLS